MTATAGTALTPQEASRHGVLLSGVEALVRLLVVRSRLDAAGGLRTATMVSGYPGSPLGTFDLTLERGGEPLARERILHRPGLNEELAAATVWGSQMGEVLEYADVDGVVGAWYGKTPGLDRSGDALKHGNAMGSGTNGGVVLFCGDDPTAKSSTLSCDSQHTFEDACIPVLCPGDQQEVLDLGVHAFRLSRYAGCWAGLKVVTAVADGIGTVDDGLERHHPQDPAATIDGQPWRHQPLATVGTHAVADQELLVVHRRLAAAKAYARHNGLDRCFGAGPGARLGIVCAGKTYYDLVQALAERGITADQLADVGIRVLKLGMTYPLVDETVVDFAGSVGEVVVIEEKRPFVETQLRAILHESGNGTRVSGKRDRDGLSLVPMVGELDPAAISTVLSRVAPDLPAVDRSPPAPARIPLAPVAARTPGFCSGCPHNRSTVAPDGALVGGGVGCHGIMYFEARQQGTRSMPPTPMGAEGVPWIGLSPFVAEPHLIQNLGDGTLSHSGTLAIRASVAAGVNITYKILYNAAVAMTGGQDVTGLLDVPALTRSLEAEGVRRTVVCAEDPSHYGRKARWAAGVDVVGRDRLPEVQEELRHVEGVTAIIYDQRCAAEARRLRKRGELDEPPRRVVINEAVCEGCGDCGAKSNCLSVLPVDTELGEKRQIHDPSCNRDYTCLEGDCPSFVTITPKAGSRATVRTPRPPAPRRQTPPGDLPAPAVPDVAGQFGVYFTGIGGTGVVTANRIIASSAERAGLAVGGMDQTGLSQKAGAVASHLHLARERDALGSATVGAGGAALYLSGDILQAAADANLEKVAPGQTVAVVDEAFTPTASMLQTSAASPDVEALKGVIADRVAGGRVAFVASKRIAEDLLGNHMLANVVLLGAAWQLGGLPLPLEHLEAAMAGSAGRGADNLAAFEWGRWAAHDAPAVADRLAAVDRAEGERSIYDPTAAAQERARTLMAGRSLPDDLAPLLARRAAQVVDYQSAGLAARYLDLLERAAAVDRPEEGWALTHAVAESWFKLLTYKDEYEVARLHLKVDHDRVAAELGIDGPYQVTYHLHPPTLRRLGLKQKLPMGRPYAAAFRLLAPMRRLRGTPLDVFGRDPDRKLERALIDDYRHLLEGVIGDSDVTYRTRVLVAESAQHIKGYGPVKDASVARWRQEVADLLAGQQQAQAR